jgi:hypothetical protein
MVKRGGVVVFCVAESALKGWRKNAPAFLQIFLRASSVAGPGGMCRDPSPFDFAQGRDDGNNRQR